jgi:hypothetical protein
MMMRRIFVSGALVLSLAPGHRKLRTGALIVLIGGYLGLEIILGKKMATIKFCGSKDSRAPTWECKKPF